jgi:tetratricopeptide (TPR) repeat protein
MIGWVRPLIMIFYAPVRGMREMRDRGSLAPVALLAFLSQAAYNFVTRKLAGASASPDLFHAAMIVVLIALILVPILTLVANTFERRGSFRVVLTQEYATIASMMFYALIAANMVGMLIAAALHYSGVQAQLVADMLQNSGRTSLGPQLTDPVIVSYYLFLMFQRALLGVGIILAVKDAFRISTLRAVGVAAVSCFGASFVAGFARPLFSGVFGSPFLLFFLYLLFRGFFSEIIGSHRAKAAFKQNLESATLNPADASAHYNLGLIHQNRGELDAARERFERALEIDPEEIDASYQLGRIARQQKRYAEAIQNFEHVVMRNPAHSQHEIWREVAATYIAAGQFEDARTALAQFLEHRPSDPEGLYLMGRAHAGLGDKREAASLMQACIEAVKTAPAYKYRASKRWLNEAEQFIKSSQ